MSPRPMIGTTVPTHIGGYEVVRRAGRRLPPSRPGVSENPARSSGTS